MLTFTALLALSASFAAASPFTATSNACGAVSICCSELAPYSANAYVYENICGIYESDQSILVGTLCEEVAGGGPCSDGTMDLCCQSLATCGGGVDGPIALNCTRQ